MEQNNNKWAFILAMTANIAIVIVIWYLVLQRRGII